MAKKPFIRKDIKEATDVLRSVMQDGLAIIADNMVKQIIAKASRLTPSQMLNAIKDVSPVGIADYRGRLQEALAVIAKDALTQARKEVPKAKSVKLAEEADSIQLGEFESLPAKIRKKVLAQSQLLVGTQIADLEKSIYFQFTSSHDSTDSMDLLADDLSTIAEEYIAGQSVYAGAAATAASTINSSRNAFFLDDQVTEQLDAFEFINADPVSEICSDLAGTIFSADDPDLNRYWPPLHWNCKSYILPVLKGDLGDRDIEKLKSVPTKAGKASIQFSESSCACGCGADHGTNPIIEAGKTLD